MELPKQGQAIRYTVLKNGRAVSTVLLPERFRNEHPFETMVFASVKGHHDLDSERWDTRAAAIEGHRALVERWRKRVLPLEDAVDVEYEGEE